MSSFLKVTQSKGSITNALKSVDLRKAVYNIIDKYPQEVIDQRREVIPTMTSERGKRKRVLLVRDTPYLNTNLYLPANASQTSNTA